MNLITNLSAEQLRHAADLKEKIASLQDQLARYLGTPARGLARVRKNKMSAAGRARIIAAQKARWAKVRAAGKAGRKPKRTLSAAARARIAAAARARWAKAKAADKKSL